MRLKHQARRIVWTAAAVTLATAFCAVPSPAHAATNSGSDSRPIPTQVFRADAPFYQKLPNDTPKAVNSDQLLAAFKRQTEEYYGTPDQPTLDVNYVKFAPALYAARNSDPAYDIIMWNCQGKTEPNWAAEVEAQLKNVHIPADMIPDQSSDSSISIYNEDSNEVVDLWQTRRNAEGQWEACWGGRITDAKNSIGQFQEGYGASASGIAQLAYTIRHQELVNGEINHVINVALPEIAPWPAMSWPANRTDGHFAGGTALTMGQMMRLPADLDIDALNLSPAAHTIAKAAQQYGIMVTESAGSVTIPAENYISLAEGNNHYGQIFRGRWAAEEMLGDPNRGEGSFPINQLEVLPLDYKAPLNNPGPTGPPPTDNPRLPSTAEPTVSTPAPTATAEPTPPASSQRWILPVGAGVLVLVIGAAFVVAKSRRRGA